MSRSDLAPPIAAYIEATNSFDLDALLASFAEHGLVNDQRREYRGRAAIRSWAAREIVGDKVTMHPTQVTRNHDNVVVTAAMDGNYDKSGLPDPLFLTFYFSLHGDRIAQLIILHNKPAQAAA